MDANANSARDSLLQHVLELKAQQRRHLISLPIEEKLTLMEAMRDRAILLRKVRQRMLSPRIKELAVKYDVSVNRFPTDVQRNHGACAGDDIMLGEFDDPDIELVAFFHELGHVLLRRFLTRGCTMCTLSHEGAAWEFGMEAAFDEGYRWEYQSKEMSWARAQLKTYAEQHK